MDPAEELNYLQLLLPLIAVVSIIALGVIVLNQQFRKSLYKQELAKEVLKNQHHQEILSTSIKVQEDERKRIAQDLHDELGAALSISRMHILRLERLAESDQKSALDELPKVRKYVESALTSTRRISHELMPAQLQTVGLAKAIEGIADGARAANALDVQVHVENDLSGLPWEMRLAIYRIYTELINNTLKHAEASVASLRIQISQALFSLRYQDNGKGLPAESTAPGIGLQSIEGRVKALNGQLEYGNHAEGGFFADIKLDLDSTQPTTPQIG